MTGAEDRGQATVEFALILPLLVVLAAGLLHLGLTLVTQIQLENAAREGARAAAVEPDRSRIRADAAVRRSLGGRPADVDVVLESEYVVVEVRMQLSVVPFVGGAGERTLMADAVMRREDLIGR